MKFKIAILFLLASFVLINCNEPIPDTENKIEENLNDDCSEDDVKLIKLLNQTSIDLTKDELANKIKSASPICDQVLISLLNSEHEIIDSEIIYKTLFWNTNLSESVLEFCLEKKDALMTYPMLGMTLLNNSPLPAGVLKRLFKEETKIPKTYLNELLLLNFSGSASFQNENSELSWPKGSELEVMISENRKELKENLALIAEGLTLMMNDDKFNKLVADLCHNDVFEEFVKSIYPNEDFGNDYSVRIATIIESYKERFEKDLIEEISIKMKKSDFELKRIEKFKTIFDSFEIGPYEQITRLSFPALDTTRYIQNGFDGQSPCNVAVKQFYEPKHSVAYYKLQDNSIISEQKSLNSKPNTPTWYIDAICISENEGLSQRILYGLNAMGCKCMTMTDLSVVCAPASLMPSSGGGCGGTPCDPNSCNILADLVLVDRIPLSSCK